jgi:hypothetical protein
MSEAKVHNYAFRKALGYVRNKKGRLGIEEVKQTFENTTKQKLAIIKNSLGEKKVVNAEKITDRCYDVGYYLYTGPNEKDSPYHYLDPHKEISQVVGEFYHNLKTPSAIFRDCEIALETNESEITVKWKKLGDYIELFFYLEGVHAGMIKESTSEAVLDSDKKGKTYSYKLTF